MFKDLFKFRKANFEKLKEYGFKKVDGKFQFETQILSEQFKLFVFVADNGEISTKVIENSLQEEYVLHLVDDAVGEFVGKVRAEFERVLTDIRDKCFEKDVFKSQQAKQVIGYIRKKYGDELEYLWEKFSNNAIWRRKDNNKWYALLLILSKRKLGINSDEIVDIIDLRIDPDKIDKLVDNEKYFKGYHMNKKSWFTICLNGSVTTETIFEFIDKSYELAKK